MSYKKLKDGLYWVKKKKRLWTDHHAILDSTGKLLAPFFKYKRKCNSALIIEQTRPRIRVKSLYLTGQWEVVGKIPKRYEQEALNRIKKALKDPNYNLFVNNCEHFARWVATGKRESRQVQMRMVVAATLAGVVILSAIGGLGAESET
ncbi:MAG: lecithin retinol acyltransferase family protein [bacterium]